MFCKFDYDLEYSYIVEGIQGVGLGHTHIDLLSFNAALCKTY